jgi:hypothetical protein
MVALQMQMLASTMKLLSPRMCSRSARRYGVIPVVVNEPLDVVAPGAVGATDGVLYHHGQALHGSATRQRRWPSPSGGTCYHLFDTASLRLAGKTHTPNAFVGQGPL